jgi:hypothetical protein
LPSSRYMPAARRTAQTSLGFRAMILLNRRSRTNVSATAHVLFCGRVPWLGV